MCCSTCATTPWCAPGRCQREPLLAQHTGMLRFGRQADLGRPFCADWVRVHNARWPKRLESRDAVLLFIAAMATAAFYTVPTDLSCTAATMDVSLSSSPRSMGVSRHGAGSENRFVSIVTGEDRKVVHWRDYMDALSASTNGCYWLRKADFGSRQGQFQGQCKAESLGMRHVAVSRRLDKAWLISSSRNVDEVFARRAESR